MNDLAPWLVLFTVGLPMIGVLTALLLLARGQSGRENLDTAAAAFVRFTMFAACCSALLLMALLSDAFGAQIETAFWRVGTVLELAGPRPLQLEWAGRMDLFSAGWVAALNGLSGLVLATARRDTNTKPRVALAVTVGLLNCAATMLVVSNTLAQMLVCWGAVSLATWQMVGWTSRVGESSRNATFPREDGGLSAIRRAITTGLFADGLLVLAVL